MTLHCFIQDLTRVNFPKITKQLLEGGGLLKRVSGIVSIYDVSTKEEAFSMTYQTVFSYRKVSNNRVTNNRRASIAQSVEHSPVEV